MINKFLTVIHKPAEDYGLHVYFYKSVETDSLDEPSTDTLLVRMIKGNDDDNIVMINQFLVAITE